MTKRLLLPLSWLNDQQKVESQILYPILLSYRKNPHYPGNIFRRLHCTSPLDLWSDHNFGGCWKRATNFVKAFFLKKKYL